MQSSYHIDVAIDGNTIRATFDGPAVGEDPWLSGEHVHTVDISPAPFIGSMEQFATRPEFRLEVGELRAIDAEGEEYDSPETLLKFYDDAHGGGYAWRVEWQRDSPLGDIGIWGVVRGDLALGEDGQIVGHEPGPGQPFGMV